MNQMHPTLGHDIQPDAVLGELAEELGSDLERAHGDSA